MAIKDVTVTSLEEQAIVAKSPVRMPLNPTAQGWSGAAVRQYLASAMLDSSDSLLSIIKSKLEDIQDNFDYMVHPSWWHVGTEILTTGTDIEVLNENLEQTPMANDLYFNTSTNNLYLCTLVDGDYSYWDYVTNIKGAQGVQGVSFRMKGAWDEDASYYNNSAYIDIVSYEGETYYCKATIETTGNSNPINDTTTWGLFVSQGRSFRMRGEWNEDTAYVVDEAHVDVVTYLGDAYYCKQSINTTGNSNPLLDTTTWGIYTEKGISFRVKGAWSAAGVSYVNNNDYIDIVYYGGKAYACKTSNTSSAGYEPDTYTTHWDLFIDGTLDTSTDTTTTAVSYTLVDQMDKTFMASGVASITIIVPSSVSHGFYAAVNVQNGASAIALTLTNNSSFTIKMMNYGVDINNYTLPSNTVVIFMFHCDGINVYCHVHEVS